MKKKILALACALTMVMGMSLSVCAESPEAASVSNQTQTITVATIEDFATKTTVAGTEVKAVDFTTASEAVAQGTALYGAGSYVATVVEIPAPANATFPYTFTINNPNVWAGQKVAVLHKVNGAWKQETIDSVADNAITLTVDSFSPFAVVIDTQNGAAVSPKTRDIVLMVGAAALVCVAGVVFASRKKVVK